MRILYLSPSDLSTAEWSWDDFYRKCVLKEREPSTPEIHWGEFCHTYTELSPEEREAKKFCITPEFKALLEQVASELKGYEKEQSFKRVFVVDDTLVVMSYRMDRMDYKKGKSIELKFPQKPWTQGRANSDIKNLCYRMFHDDLWLWCTTAENGVEKFKITKTQEEAEQAVHEAIRAVVGRLLNNYF